MKKINEKIVKEVLRETLKKVIKEKANFPKLKNIYDGCGNESELVSLNETNAKRLIDRHKNSGYAIISACRGFNDFGLDSTNINDVNKLREINNKRTKDLIKRVQNEGFSYTLCFGGFIENQGEDDEEQVYEQSVIVYAQKRNGEIDNKSLFNFAIDMAKVFNQDAILFCAQGENPKYYDKNGNVDMEFGNDILFNDLTQTYFTDLHKNTKDKIKNLSRPTRFSFNETYIAPIPQCYSESHKRYMLGEVFLKK